jgi:hypothetical protein
MTFCVAGVSFPTTGGLRPVQVVSNLPKNCFVNAELHSSFCNLHSGLKGIRGEIIIILRFERRVCRWESCRMHHSLTMHGFVA